MNESQQLLRQWKLLQLLAESRVGFTMQELVETFEVSLRSIQRDIAVLQSAGFPLENVTAERNLKRWKMRPFSEQTGFNFADMISIVMSRRFLEPLAGTPFWEGHQKVYRKVRGAMGEQALRFCEQLNQTIRVSGFGTSDYTKRVQTIDKIQQAMVCTTHTHTSTGHGLRSLDHPAKRFDARIDCRHSVPAATRFSRNVNGSDCGKRSLTMQ